MSRVHKRVEVDDSLVIVMHGPSPPKPPSRFRNGVWAALIFVAAIASMGGRSCWGVEELPASRTFAEVEAEMRLEFARTFCPDADIERCTNEQREQLETDVRSLRTTYTERTSK